MKFIPFLTLILITTSVSIGQNIVNPPNTVSVSNNVLIDKTPVNNLMVLEFMTAIKQLGDLKKDYFLLQVKKKDKDLAIYEKYLSKWSSRKATLIREFETFENQKTGNNSTKGAHIRHYNNSSESIISFPKELAIAFCDWRSDAVNLLFEAEGTVNYSLPMKNDLEDAYLYFIKQDNYRSTEAIERMSREEVSKSNMFFTATQKELTLDEPQPSSYVFRCKCTIDAQE